jgi:hemerythrin-like metal-binding protein
MGMPFFEWTDRYGVGIQRVDQEHKQLVAILNDVYDAICADKTDDAMEVALKGLLDYTETHFAHEEELMKVYAYPGLPEHKLEHEDLTQKVIALFGEFHEREPGIPLRMTNMLRDWLARHIMRTDKAFGAYANSKSVR